MSTLPKHIVVIIASLLLLLSVVGFPTITNQARGSSPVDFSVEADAETSPGEEVTVQIAVSTKQHSLYGVQYTMSYEPSVIDTEEISKGSFLSQNASSIVITRQDNKTAGRIEYAETRTGADKGVTGDGRITTITFKISDDADEQTVPFQITRAKASDADANSLSTTTTNGSVQITTEESPTPTPTPTQTTPTPTPSTETPATPSTPAAQAGGQLNLSDKIKEEMKENESIPVIVTIQNQKDSPNVTETLRDNGASDISRIESNAVSAVATESAIRSTAVLPSVKSISYNSRMADGDSQNDQTITVQETSDTSISTTSTETKIQSTAGEEGPGFGLVAGLISLILATITLSSYRR